MNATEDRERAGREEAERERSQEGWRGGAGRAGVRTERAPGSLAERFPSMSLHHLRSSGKARWLLPRA